MKLTPLLILFSLSGLIPCTSVHAADTATRPVVRDVTSEEINSLRQAVSIEAVESSVLDSGDTALSPAYSGATMNLCAGNNCTKTGLRLHDRLRAVDLRIEADKDGDGFSIAAGDCDDGDPLTYPDAYDYADGIDNNCDGLIDNGVRLAR